MLTADVLNQSVNHLTGQITFPVRLIDLPGRNGLRARVSIRYDGGVQASAGTWNLEAGTGVVGLGFSLDTEYIVAVPDQSAAAGNITYYHVAGQAATRLVNTAAPGQTPAFTAEGRQPWLIAYDAANEGWTVTKEDGTVFRFGGAAGNAVQWGVRWGAFLGASSQTSGQSRGAVIWSLASVTSPFGDTLTYAYSAYPDDNIAVGAGGLAYTRASYLLSITDSVGRVISLQYGDKLQEPSGQREYVAPHSGQYNTPNAYQDRYETRFLSSIRVTDAAGRLLETVSLGYAVVGDGLLAKRYLTSVTLTSAAGAALPSLKLAYLYQDAKGAPLGVLDRVTLPEGGVFQYTHTAASPARPIADRTTSILKTGVSKPRVYAYANYTVVTWYDGTSRFADVYVYTWTGRWVEDALPDIGVYDQYDNLQVATAADLFAIYRPTYTVSSPVKPSLDLVHQDAAQPGKHVYARFELTSLTDGEPVEVVAGRRYVAVLGKQSGQLLRFTWTGASWTQEAAIQLPYATQSPCYSVAGDHNYLAVIARPYSSPDETAQLRLLYIDDQGAWQTGFQGPIVTTAQNADSVKLFAGDAFAILEVENDRLGLNEYRYQAITWDARYGSPRATDLVTTGVGEHYTVAIRGALVGIDTHVFRFDGRDFSHHVDLSDRAYRYPNQTGGRLLAYGFDKVVRRVEQAYDGEILGYAYDITEFFPATGQLAVGAFNGANRPSRQETEWGFFPRTSSTIRFPSNFVLLSDQLYYENPDFSWAVVGTIPDDVAKNNAASVQISGSRFLCYQKGADSHVIPLKNGAPLSPIVLTGRSIYTTSTQLVGPLGLVSYTGSFDTPGSLQIHALVADGLIDPVTNYVVTRVDVDGGFGKRSIAYTYDQASATSAPSGYANLYNKITIASGAAADGSAPHGSTEKYLFNGLPSALLALPFPADTAYTNASSYYGLFTGLTYCEIARTSAAAEAARTTLYWMAYLAPLAHVTVGRRLRQTRSDNTTDGVSGTVTSTYNDAGLLRSTTATNTAWDGSVEEISDVVAYAAEVYPAMAALNMLVQVAQSKRTVGAIATAITATTWQPWNGTQYAPFKTFQALSNTTDFNFTAWSGNQDPPTSTWLKTSQVSRRSSYGLTLEATNQDGITISTLYDTTQSLRVAEFQNASVAGQEASYCGFEDYEAASGWALSGGAASDTQDAHTGVASLRVPASGSSSPTLALRRSFTPATQARAYVFSFWVKTAPGFAGDPGSAHVEIAFSDGRPVQRLPITDTAGAWARIESGPISPSTSGATVTVTISAYTQKASAFYLLDDLVFAPAVCAFGASVYLAPNLVVSAELSLDGTMRYLHDGFQRRVATVGPAESVNALTLDFLARQAGATNAAPSLPNAVTTCGARAGGAYLPFQADWASQWQVTDASRWQAANGALVYAGTSGTATWSGYTGQQNYGVRVQIDPPSGGAFAGQVSLSLGNVQVSWKPDPANPGQGAYYLGAVPLTNPLGGSFPYDREWTLAYVDGRVLFWSGGWLLVDTIQSGAVPGTVTLSAQAPAAFRDLVTFVEPTLEISYADGLGNAQQVQVMTGAGTVSVTQTLFDGLARGAIQSKSATYTVGGAGALFGYRTDYITNADSVWSDGVMTGAITTYLPADEGYPYSRSVFEASPLGRVIEVGLPGKSFAVGQHSTRYAYGTNTTGSLPLRSYFVTTKTDPDGVIVTSTVDRGGNLIVQQVASSGATLATTTYSYVWTSSGRAITVYPPDAAAPPPPTQRSDYAVLSQYNYLGHLVKTSGRTEGDTRAIYDASGRLRFRMTADGVNTNPAANVVQYFTYDAVGRPLDDGTTTCDWSRLPAIAPPSYVPPSPLTPRVQRAYFGPGSGDLGRLASVNITAAGARKPDVLKSMTYDAAGNVASVALTVADYGSSTYRVDYTYDNFRNPATITYLDSSTLVVNYTYNRRGLLDTAAKDGAPAFASYLYDADGAIAKESLGVWGSQGVSRTYTYNSPGWISTVSYRYLAQTLLYDQPGAGYKGATYYSGLVAAEAYSPVWSGAPAGYTNQYAYDGLGQLKYALNNLNTEWGIGIGPGVQYDASGNLLQLNRGNTMLKYAYQVPNQVAQVSGSVSAQFTYTPSGSVASALPSIRTITYDPLWTRATSVAVATGAQPTLAFRYDEQARRVYKAVTTGGATRATLYVHGLAAQPLVEIDRDTSGAEVVTLHVYTPNGRVAFVRGGATYNVLRDALGSTRVIIDSTGGVVASYDYMPFGKLMRTTGTPDTLRYRYTGQEFDPFSATLDDGLYNYRARLYDWNLSRFYAPDPARQLGTPYAYVGNNPVSLADPTGESWRDVLGVIGAVVGAAAAGIAVGALLPATPAVLAGATILLGAYAAGRAVGGAVGIARGAEGTDLLDYGTSYGIAGLTAAAGALGAPLVGLSTGSIVLAEGFGLYNGYSLAPADSNPASFGYYLAAGIAVSFAGEALGNTAVRFSSRVAYNAVENTVLNSLQASVVQRGVSGFTSGLLLSGGSAAAAGSGTGEVTRRALVGGFAYGLGSGAGGAFRGAGAYVRPGPFTLSGVASGVAARNFAPLTGYLTQQALEKIVKQTFVVALDENVRESRIALVQRYLF
ncbi:RHS repeat domain-containing protein [Sorangium sp. So ce1335]|uniref:RHS repeat domain-containing protein n=1 Tax=Sorangium sp. So ce1335 TaxID=3133335 RepID=UPI003F5FAB51